MKESRAWRALAEDHDAGKGSWFLCNSLKYAEIHKLKVAAASESVRNAMVERIKQDVGHNGPAYDGEWADGSERESRVLACLMFAEQAADEERAK